MKLEHNHERRLLSLLVGASAAMIGLTTISLTVSVSGFGPEVIKGTKWIGLMLAVSSSATLLVMSMLHGNLRELYRELSDSRSNAWQDARRDPLTGLANRKRLVEELDRLLLDNQRCRTQALIFLDLDQFKRVNDTLGHHVGDALIRSVAQRLIDNVPDSLVARLGGDEFALIVPANTKHQLTAIGNRIVKSLTGKYEIEGTTISVGVSVGASHMRNAGDLSMIMRQADIAMYEAKRSGGGYQQFDDQMNRQIERRIRVERRLIDVLCDHSVTSAVGTPIPKLTTKFHPVFDLNGRIVAAEALLRWDDEETGPISPQELVSIAEDAHLISELGQHIARSAMMAASELGDIPICLNVSALELLDPEYLRRLKAITSEFGVDPGRIQIEISERAIIERGSEIQENLAHLTKAGFVLSVDDFGASMASIRHLSSHEVSIVKLDRSLLETAQSSGNIAVLKALVELVKSHGLSVVSEGVADETDEAIARASGCQFMQGFQFSKAVTLPQLRRLIDDERTRESAAKIVKLSA